MGCGEGRSRNPHSGRSSQEEQRRSVVDQGLLPLDRVRDGGDKAEDDGRLREPAMRAVTAKGPPDDPHETLSGVMISKGIERWRITPLAVCPIVSIIVCTS